MIVKRTRATAGIATAFVLLAAGAPGAATSVITSSPQSTDDAVVPPTPEPSFAPDDVEYRPTRDVSVDVPSVRGRNLAAASQTTVRRADRVPAGEIPDRALAAYAFAAQAMEEADPECGLRWSLLAAIGRIESDHGRSGEGKIRATGRAVPFVRGDQLDGKGGRDKVRDTDGGRYDDDRRWDRAVGPMQLLPSTWSYVGVDGDGNGKRNPDDADDAALAVAVYLCAAADKALADDKGRRTPEDAEKGLRKALDWFNPSDAYGDLARRLDRTYFENYGVTPYSSAPESLRLQTVALVEPLDEVVPTGGAAKDDDVKAARSGSQGRGGATTKSAKDSDKSKNDGSGKDRPKGDAPKGNGPTDDPNDDAKGGDPVHPAPTPAPTPTPTPTPTPPSIPAPVPGVLSGELTVCGAYYCVDGVPVEAGDFALALQSLLDQAVDAAAQATADAQAAADAAAEQNGTEPEQVEPVEPEVPTVSVDVDDLVDDPIDPDDDMPTVTGVH